MRRFALSLLVLVVLLVACAPGATPEPTAFPTVAATLTPPSQIPVALNLTDLIASPGLYLDVPVQVSGRFRRQPLLVCPADPHPAPTSWALGEAGLELPAAGFDQEVRALLPEELTVAVEGRLRRWQGLVGCGKQAQQREIWYFDVSRILSPNPLAMITLTPGGEATAIADAGGTAATPTMEPFATADAFATPDLFASPTLDVFAPLPEATEPVSGYPGEATAPGFEVPTDEPPAETPDPFATTPSGNGTPTAVGSSPTPGGSVTPVGTPPATTTPGTASPTATTGAPGEVVDMGDVFNIDEEFTAVRLDANTAHRWTIEIFEDESFTVSAIAPPPADMVLSITRDGQPVITQQNTTGAGTAETIREPSLPGEGTYEIVVQNGGGAATEYALIAYIAGDFEVQFKGFLSSSTPQSNVTMAAEESHYWFFMAGAGNQLDATLTPDANADIVGEFFGPEAEFLEIADEGVAGEAESLESLPLAASGMHVVRISEIDYAGMNYSILITLR